MPCFEYWEEEEICPGILQLAIRLYLNEQGKNLYNGLLESATENHYDTVKKRLDLSILSKVDIRFWQVGCHGGMKGDSIFSIPLPLDL